MVIHHHQSIFDHWKMVWPNLHGAVYWSCFGCSECRAFAFGLIFDTGFALGERKGLGVLQRWKGGSHCWQQPSLLGWKGSEFLCEIAWSWVLCILPQFLTFQTIHKRSPKTTNTMATAMTMDMMAMATNMTATGNDDEHSNTNDNGHNDSNSNK